MSQSVSRLRSFAPSNTAAWKGVARPPEPAFGPPVLPELGNILFEALDKKARASAETELRLTAELQKLQATVADESECQRRITDELREAAGERESTKSALRTQ